MWGRYGFTPTAVYGAQCNVDRFAFGHVKGVIIFRVQRRFTSLTSLTSIGIGHGIGVYLYPGRDNLDERLPREG